MSIIVTSINEDGQSPEPENCCMCSSMTTYWNRKKDVPVCITCSSEKTMDDIPAKDIWIASIYQNIPDIHTI